MVQAFRTKRNASTRMECKRMECKGKQFAVNSKDDASWGWTDFSAEASWWDIEEWEPYVVDGCVRMRATITMAGTGGRPQGVGVGGTA